MAVLKTPDAVLKVAEREVGYLEKRSNASLYDKTANAGSNNYTKYANDFDTKYPSFYNYRKQTVAWCDMFVDWCFVTAFGEAAAREMLFQPAKSAGAGCSFSADYYRAHGAFYTTPKVGDQIFFGKRGAEQHTGLVYKVDASRVNTIEGNTSNASGVVANGGVAKKSYPLTYGQIAGYGRPKYDAGAEPEKTAAPKTTGGFDMKEFRNSSGKSLKVYADTKKQTEVGELFAGTACKALDQQGAMVCVRYKVNATGAYKVGWVEYVKGVLT
ncbi:MAG: CHAP domain-containing protein [Clostridia bacterium]|nr:CHAP domain-containing protein [Clostridia bacterium]